MLSVTWLAEAPRSSSRLSSVVIPAGRRLTELEPQSMESVCLVVAILDLYIVGVNRRNCGLALGEDRERVIMRGRVNQPISAIQFIFCKHFLLGCNLLTL